MQGNLFQLREIKVVGSPGANPLLDLAGQATMCYVVQDEAVSNAGDWHEAPKLSLESSDVSQTSRAASEGDMQVMTAIQNVHPKSNACSWGGILVHPNCIADEPPSLCHLHRIRAEAGGLGCQKVARCLRVTRPCTIMLSFSVNRNVSLHMPPQPVPLIRCLPVDNSRVRKAGS